jgi:ATP-dependent DNA helicase DinG
LSLWQGVDVPGPACTLVVIDRIPFPRPDDPLMSARAQAVADAGGNGFLAVSATHAALRMAQGAGRLVRSGSDRGVVAVLDSRLATARYGGFLRTSMPPLWPTVDRATVLAALRRLDAAGGELRAVDEPALRGPVPAQAAGAAPGQPRSAAPPGPPAPPAPVPEATRTAVVQGRGWDAEQDDELREGVELGLTLEELADHLDLDVDGVAQRLTALGLTPAPAP